MNRVILLGLLVLLGGCSKIEKESKEAVLSILKDPESAQFQNVKGVCGEVNSKNSYGGYTGFNRFIVINNRAVLESASEEDTLPFQLNWMAYCSKNESNDDEKSQCVDNAETSAAAFKAKERDLTIQEVKQAIRNVDNNKESIKVGDKLIDEAYASKFKSADMHALEVLNNCLKH
ncbi:hypothetical protein SOI81_11280 [Acinetobacter pittii]|uniref:hypothetical protein n=1 Tax=Acinetobacter pittii TaxID=48296 RepID=UPI002A6A54D6|nr:hypothetical protein [Acinetobacter pittii]WPP68960.1 hypothetical protein SOI81_11280 [Acinetobacter pittii]